MSLTEKLRDAESSDWLREGMTEEEVSKIISEAKEEARERIKLIDTLDKIRDEIEGMTPTYHNPDWSITDLVPISEVLDVIDKYKARSEK